MEVELKLLIAPEHLARLAELEVIRRLCVEAPRIERLHTRYYDTPARELAQAGIALRVRRAGEAWVQTLKAGGRSAGGLHERVELEWRIADATLDLTRLAETSYAAVFAEPALREALQPVFETEFERTAIQLAWPDGARAELALDHGEVRAGSRAETVSEAEIELIDGDAEHLFALAMAIAQHVPLRLGDVSKAARGDALATNRVRAPVKAQSVQLDAQMTVAQGLRHVGSACLTQMQANESGALAGTDAEYLHQLRVGLRRVRVLVDLLRFVAPKREVAAMRDALRTLGKALNRARDWDVYLDEILPALIEDVADAAKPRANGEHLRRRAQAQVQETLTSTQYGALMLQLAHRFSLPDLGIEANGRGKKKIALDAPVGDLARIALDRVDRRMRKAGARLDQAGKGARHAVRIRAKKARYTAEFFSTLYADDDVEAYVGALREMQSVLGILNDLAQCVRLTKKARGDETDEALVDSVRRWAAKRQASELKRCVKRWEKFGRTTPFWR